MKRILVTGMSGTGKSTVTGELAARGYKAVDADTDEYSEWVEVVGDTSGLGSPAWGARDWMWREDRVQALLSTEDANMLFVSGCAVNMRAFLPQFDHVVLLSVPADVLVERLRTRTSNSYGKDPEEVARVLELVDTVEPLLRRGLRDRRQRAPRRRRGGAAPAGAAIGTQAAEWALVVGWHAAISIAVQKS